MPNVAACQLAPTSEASSFPRSMLSSQCIPTAILSHSTPSTADLQTHFSKTNISCGEYNFTTSHVSAVASTTVPHSTVGLQTTSITAVPQSTVESLSTTVPRSIMTTTIPKSRCTSGHLKC